MLMEALTRNYEFWDKMERLQPAMKPRLDGYREANGKVLTELKILLGANERAMREDIPQFVRSLKAQAQRYEAQADVEVLEADGSVIVGNEHALGMSVVYKRAASQVAQLLNYVRVEK